ncbi:hypothetical protein I7I48_09279 [Histoplasma ohiense]|nr:hypothetical protein I7I48_09279 [Histoplasma ohiense (nom. inval.)]
MLPILPSHGRTLQITCLTIYKTRMLRSTRSKLRNCCGIITENNPFIPGSFNFPGTICGLFFQYKASCNFTRDRVVISRRIQNQQQPANYAFEPDKEIPSFPPQLFFIFGFGGFLPLLPGSLYCVSFFLE